ncbi:MAG: protein jag, partial [Acidimicrobiales bacterium]
MSETLESDERATEATGPEASATTTGEADEAEGSAQAGESAEAGEDGPSHQEVLVREGDIAGDYLERLLDILDFDGDIDLDVEAGRAVVSIDGGKDLEKLVGSRGDVLESLQELTRLAVQQSTGTRNRLMLDIAGWRSHRRSELSELGRQAARDVVNSGQPERLRPMTPFERKV